MDKAQPKVALQKTTPGSPIKDYLDIADIRIQTKKSDSCNNITNEVEARVSSGQLSSSIPLSSSPVKLIKVQLGFS